MELQKTRKAFGSPSAPGKKKIHYSEPSKQVYYSESRLLMDYPFEALSFLARLSMELQKISKAFGSPSTPGQKNFHYSEPSKQFYY